MIVAVRTQARRSKVGLAVLIVAGALLAACSGAATPSPAPAGLSIDGAWARTSPKVANAGAAYLVIKNPGTVADALVGASSPASGTAQVHETYTLPAPSGSTMQGASPSTGAMMGMRPVAKIDIPAGGSIELKPGGYHIMLMELKQELKAGTTIPLTLTFEKAAPMTVNAEVRAN